MIEPLLKTEMCPVIPNLQRCKALARTIKHQRKPAWPSVINSELPSKHISDQLVDGYLRTIETVYRVLHIPTFKRDYEALWTSGDKPDQAFLVLVKLVLAIGAAVYDENFSLKAAATQWVFEAQTWIAEPNVKKHLHLQGLQIHIILLFAREIDDVAGDSVYMSAGDLYRRAVIMGLHRDPTQLPQKSVYVTEMRRRMWSTILEVCLQSSLMTGAPPLLSLNDFDTQPPSNLDDDQLGLEAPAPKSETRFTQVSVALALRKTFPVRLSIIKSLNDLHRINSYEETLQLDTELRDCYRAVSRVLQTFKSDSDLDFSQFGLQMVDLLMQRYIAALHIPFFGSSLDQSAFAFSRKVTIEASLRIWYIVRPLSTTMAGRTERDSDTLAAQDISRLAVSGAGLFRNAATQSALLIAVELKAQLQDDDSLGPTPVRPDLIAVLRDSVDWGLHCIKNGETNIKGYLMSRLIIAQIEAIIRGVHRDEMARIMVNATIDAENVCLPILEEMADDTNSDEVALDAQKTAFSSPSDVDWDLMVSGKKLEVQILSLTFNR